MEILVVIPARGGSKGIPRKNIRLMCGKPLISYSIENALKSSFDLDVVVSTDDEEIEKISELYGAKVLKRPSELATDQVTLDPVINHTVLEMEKQNNKKYTCVITMQPTSPLLTVSTLDKAINYYLNNNFDTLISGINKPHLSWTEREGEIIPSYKERLNRQYLPKNFLETGAFVITARQSVTEKSRLGPIVSIFEVPEKESLDIDNPQDWWIAEKELRKKYILIRTDGYAEIGLGHIYRALLLAYNLIDHEIRFVLSKKSDLGIEKIKSSYFKYDVIENDFEITKLIEKYNADILINDILDTSKKYIEFCKQSDIRIVNFEDLGQGAQYADAVINDLYEKKNNYDNHYWGSDFYCIRDEFLLTKPTEFKELVREVLILFGGTDPCNLTEKVLKAINQLTVSNVQFTFILGLGYQNADDFIKATQESKHSIKVLKNVKHISEYMGNAEIAISSQGRTMLELASISVPTILMAQNERELNHEFGYLENGFINLGLGSEVEENTIVSTLNWLINSPQIRKQMKEQMLKKDLKKGIGRVINIILDENC